LPQQLLRKFPPQSIPQHETGIGRIPNPESADHLLIESASLEILTRIRAFRTPQTFLKKCRRAHMHIKQRHAHLSVASLRRTGKTHLWHRHAQLLRDQPDRLRESDVFDLLDERKDISRLPAAEAVKELARSVHRKRRRLLGVKRTKPGKVLRPSLLQLDVIPDNADDIRLLLEGLFEVIGRSGGHWAHTGPLVIMGVERSAGNSPGTPGLGERC